MYLSSMLGATPITAIVKLAQKVAPANAPAAATAAAPTASVPIVPMPETVDRKWLYIGGGIVAVGAVYFLLRRR